MSFEALISSQKFQSFLLANNAAMPSNFKLRNNKARLKNTLTNTASIELTYYDEIRANNGVEFIRLFWYNNAQDPQYFKSDDEPKTLSPQEQAKRKRQQEQRERKLQEEQLKACQRAQTEYATAAVPCKSHAYTTTKGVQPHYGVKIATQTLFDLDQEGNKIYRICKGEMIIPIISLDKQFMGYQRIRTDGRKLQCRDGLKNKGFFPLGGWNSKKTKKVVLCEGYATGATLYEATGLTVFVCFDVGNVQALATQMKARFPDIEIIIATDFDLEKEQAGLITGLRLAQQFDLKVVFPLAVVNGSDWNDLQAESGQDYVRELFFNLLDEYNGKTIEQATSIYHDFLNEKNLQKLVA